MANANSTGRVSSRPDTLEIFSRRAWAVHNILSFMVEAVDDDVADGLPIRTTLVDLQQMVSALATDLSDASDEIGGKS